MRIETKGGPITVGFGGTSITVPGPPPVRYLVLSRAERETLERAERLLGRIRAAVDPNRRMDYGLRDGDGETVASAEAFVGEVARSGRFRVIE